jgi:thiol-disulfide isomerase/thioredoxin
MKCLMLNVVLLFCCSTVFSQYVYNWENETISLTSPVKLEKKISSMEMALEGNEIRALFSRILGMEGISGLTGSLESFSNSFGYLVLEKARPYSGLKGFDAAIIEVNKDGGKVFLCMFASLDYQKHYTCEIRFSEPKRGLALSLLRGISSSQIENQDEFIEVVDESEESPEESEPDNTEISPGKIRNGLPAPDFTLYNADGKEISLSAFKGKTVMLDFWGTWCGPCIQLIPELKALYEKYQAKDFVILGVANDKDFEKWKNVLKTKQMVWPNLIDTDEKIVNLYNISAFPTLILIDKNGVIIESKATKQFVENYLNNQPQPGVNLPKGIKNKHVTGTAVEKKVWELLSRYSIDGYTILDDYFTAPSSYQGRTVSGADDFTVWIDGTSENDVVKSLNTVVHEMCHGYTGKLYLKALRDAGKPIGNDSYSAFYLGNAEMSVVKHSKVYPTNEIHAIFPRQLITSRYETYIYPSEPVMGSQQHGVYGLLDELNAYYHGTRVSLDLYHYYLENQNNAKGWLQFFADFYGTYYAYLEFKSYMIFYMLYAEKNYRDIYSGILANKEFLVAFKKTDENWIRLIGHFQDIKAEIAKKLKAQGMSLTEKDGFTYIGSNGIGNFSKTYKLFQDELKNTKYQVMAKTLGLSAAHGPDMEF